MKIEVITLIQSSPVDTQIITCGCTFSCTSVTVRGGGGCSYRFIQTLQRLSLSWASLSFTMTAPSEGSPPSLSRASNSSPSFGGAESMRPIREHILEVAVQPIYFWCPRTVGMQESGDDSGITVGFWIMRRCKFVIICHSGSVDHRQL